MIRQQLPKEIYSAEQCKALDQYAINTLGVPGYQLMKRAAQAAFALVRQRWSQVRSLSIWVGAGNNGGDGVALAKIAYEAGWRVQLVTPDQSFADKLCGEAADAWADLPPAIQPEVYSDQLSVVGELVVDALLGIGLKGSVREPVASMISAINQLSKPVLSLDVPSGLDADTGASLGVTVTAESTLTFIANKQGWLVNQGAQYSGARYWAGLGLPQPVNPQMSPVAQLTLASDLESVLPKRSRTSHKGNFGVVLVLGGNQGMGGAGLMAAEAALRAGAGRVILGTRAEHVSAMLARVPEVMTRALTEDSVLDELIVQADVIVLGPGLGKDDWANGLLHRVLRETKPRVIDADALNLISEQQLRIAGDFVLTPHPAEAARLLGVKTAKVVADPVEAIDRLSKIFQGSLVLKGAGTLCLAPNTTLAICDRGNPGMATAGMGDVLSGIIAALLAQGLSSFDAARLGVWVHASAADRVAQGGEIGMLATDLLASLRAVLNPGSQSCNR